MICMTFSSIKIYKFNRMARESLCVAQNVPAYLSRLQQQILNSVNELIRTIRRQFIRRILVALLEQKIVRRKTKPIQHNQEREV